MGLLYFFESTVDYHGMAQKEFFKLWARHGGEAALLFQKGIIKYAFKIAGERKIIGVLEVDDPGVLDTVFTVLPMYQTMGDQITTEFTPLRSYESFASDVNKRSGNETSNGDISPVQKKGLFYLVTFTVGYNGLSQEEFFKNWAEEVKAAMEAKKAGLVLDFWKVIAERKVIVIACVEDPDELDRVSMDLPIMKSMGDKVLIKCKSIRPTSEWSTDLKKLAA